MSNLALLPPPGWTVSAANHNDGDDATFTELDIGTHHPNNNFDVTFTKGAGAADFPGLTAFRVLFAQDDGFGSAISTIILSKAAPGPLTLYTLAGSWQDTSYDSGIVPLDSALPAQSATFTIRLTLVSTFSYGAVRCYELELYDTLGRVLVVRAASGHLVAWRIGNT